MVSTDEYESVLSDYYGSGAVRALITVKGETKNIDAMAEELASFDNVIDLYLVTGDTDIIMNVVFENYASLKKFIVEKVGALEGVQDTNTMMIITAYKEKGSRQ